MNKNDQLEFEKQQQIILLKKTISEQNVHLKKWKLLFDIRVLPKSEDGKRKFELLVRYRNPGEAIISEVFSEEELQNFIDDPALMVNTITDSIYNNMYRDKIRNHIRIPIDKALTNALTLIGNNK